MASGVLLRTTTPYQAVATDASVDEASQTDELGNFACCDDNRPRRYYGQLLAALGWEREG